MYDHDRPQPVLTSHELTARRVAGPSRGKQRFDVTRPSSPGRDGNRDFGNRREGFRPRDNRPPRQPREPKPQGFCHDKLLALYKGKEIHYALATGVTARVKLLDLDRYTLLVEHENQLYVVYKSAIAGLVLPKLETVKAEGEAA